MVTGFIWKVQFFWNVKILMFILLSLGSKQCLKNPENLNWVKVISDNFGKKNVFTVFSFTNPKYLMT